MGKLVHYYKTYQWAIEVGFSEKEAREIALADWKVDILEPGERYVRGRHLNTNLLTPFGGMPTQLWYAGYYLRQAICKKSLADLGKALHSIQDLVGHGSWPIYGYHWKGPWRIVLFGRGFKLRKYDPDSDFSQRRLEKLEELTKQFLGDYLKAT